MESPIRTSELDLPFDLPLGKVSGTQGFEEIKHICETLPVS
jgi:hypothetical protein